MIVWSLIPRLYLQLLQDTSFDEKVPQARILEAVANNGKQGAGCVEYSHPQHGIFKSLTLFSLDLSCFPTVNDALQLKRILDL